MKDSSSHFVETGEGFECSIDWKELSSYLEPFPDDIALIDPLFNQRIINHLKQCKELIEQSLPKIEENLQTISKSLENDPLDDYKLPIVNPANCDSHRIIRFLFKKIKKYSEINNKQRYNTVKHHLDLLNSLSRLIDFILSFNPNPKHIMIKIKRALEPVDRTVYAFTRPDAHLPHMLRRLFNEELIKIHLIPTPFNSHIQNLQYFKEIVQVGVIAKKPGTPYFPELPAESSLPVFFQSPGSPLLQKRFKTVDSLWDGPFLPYDETKTTPMMVQNWISEATYQVFEWLKRGFPDETFNEDESNAIERYLFSSTYPLLYRWDNLEVDVEDSDLSDISDSSRIYHFETSAAIEFSIKMKEFAKQTPEQIGIQSKYVPQACRNQPVSKMFEVDSISRAPLEWLNSALNQVSPIDTAYCIVKVHESLSVMAVLRATATKEISQIQDFCETMPGFDDIFEIWLSLICSSGIPEPQRIMNYINIYSKLPGFTGRVMASIAYLEASLCQLTNTFSGKTD